MFKVHWSKVDKQLKLNADGKVILNTEIGPETKELTSKSDPKDEIRGVEIRDKENQCLISPSPLTSKVTMKKPEVRKGPLFSPFKKSLQLEEISETEEQEEEVEKIKKHKESSEAIPIKGKTKRKLDEEEPFEEEDVIRNVSTPLKTKAKKDRCIKGTRLIFWIFGALQTLI
jgi:hypothetical protein